MNSMSTGLWPTVPAPASDARALEQRVALAQANAAPDPHRVRESRGLIDRVREAFHGVPARTGRALA